MFKTVFSFLLTSPSGGHTEWLVAPRSGNGGLIGLLPAAVRSPVGDLEFFVLLEGSNVDSILA